MSNHNDDDVLDHDEIYESDLDGNIVDDLEALIADEEIVDEQDDLPVSEASENVRIELLVNVNGFKRGDVIVVDSADKFFGGLIDQGLAKETVDGV